MWKHDLNRKENVLLFLSSNQFLSYLVNIFYTFDIKEKNINY